MKNKQRRVAPTPLTISQTTTIIHTLHHQNNRSQLLIMANNGNPPIDHYRYLNAKHAKPVLLLMLKHADLPDNIALRLRDNLSNFIDSPQDQTEINVEINR